MTNFASRFSDNATDSLGLSFAKVYNLWHQQVKEALQELQITHPQFIVLASLAYLSQQGEVNQVALAKHSGIDVMTVSTILKNLLKKKLITRQVAPNDTRAKVVKLTKAGQAKVNQATPLVEQIDQQFFAVLGPQKAELNQMLLQLTHQE